MPVEDSNKRLLRLMSRFEVNIAQSFTSAVAVAKSNMFVAELVDLLERGQFEMALAKFESIPLSVSTNVNLSVTETGASTSKVIAGITSTPTFFDQTNQRAVNIMRENRGRLIREFAQSQRATVTDVITDGITRGLNPIEQARNFRNSVGLTEYQNKAVRNFERMLRENDSKALTRKLRDGRFDRSIINAIKSDKPLQQRQINKMVKRYRERFIKYRAEAIGRTEALRSVHQANNEAFTQAIEAGTLEQDELESTWHVLSDSNLRDSHAFLSGVTQPFGQPFLSGNGSFLRYPGDPSAQASDTINCRCALTTVFIRRGV